MGARAPAPIGLRSVNATGPLTTGGPAMAKLLSQLTDRLRGNNRRPYLDIDQLVPVGQQSDGDLQVNSPALSTLVKILVQ